MIARETHEDGGHHLHILLRTKEKYDCRRADFFDMYGCHGNYKAVRSFKQSIEYLKKEDQEPLIFGDIVVDKTWQDIANSETESEVWKNLWDLKPRDAMLSGDRIVSNWRKRKRALGPPQPPADPDEVKDAEPTVKLIWFYGEGGSGKDRRVQKICHLEQATCYIKRTETGQWWEGYNGEQCVVFEDFRANDMRLHQFFQLTDPFRRPGYTVPIKGGFVPLKADTFFVTTGVHPIDLWKSTRTSDRDWGMLKRRLTKVYETYEYFADDWRKGMTDRTEDEPPAREIRDTGPIFVS